MFKRGDKLIFTNASGNKFNVTMFIPKPVGMPGFAVVWFEGQENGDGQTVSVKQLTPR